MPSIEEAPVPNPEDQPVNAELPTEGVDAATFQEVEVPLLTNPFAAEIETILALKAETKYVEADDVAWRVLASSEFDVVDIGEILSLQISEFVAEFPEVYRRDLAVVVTELGKSYEMKNEIRLGNRQESSGADVSMEALKLYLLASVLDPDNSEAARRLADNCVKIRSEDFAAFRQDANFSTSTLSFETFTPDRAVLELQVESIARLLHVIGLPPFNITDGMLHGETPFPDFSTNTTESGQMDLVGVTWALGNGAKLAVRIASRYFQEANIEDKATFATWAVNLGSSILSAMKVDRELGKATEQINKECKKDEPFGNRRRTVAHALSAIGSGSEFLDDPRSARKWYELALKVDSNLRFVRNRLDDMGEGPSVSSNVRAVNALLERHVPLPTTPTFSDWETEFSARKKSVSPGITPRIDNLRMVRDVSDLQAVAYDFAQRWAVIAAEPALADVFLEHTEGKRDDYWGTAYDERGNLELQADIALTRLILERKHTDRTDRVNAHVEALSAIRDASIDQVGVPGDEALFPFFRDIVNWVNADLVKH